MTKKHSVATQMLTLIMCFGLIALTSPNAHAICWTTETVYSPPPDCACGPIWATGTCPSGGSYLPPTYVKCKGIDDPGFLICNSQATNLGYEYTCTTSWSYGTIALCVGLAIGCSITCALCIAPNPTTPPSCAACVACLLGEGVSGCFGCAIRSCSLTQGAPVSVSVYKNSSGVCPPVGG